MNRKNWQIWIEKTEVVDLTEGVVAATEEETMETSVVQVADSKKEIMETALEEVATIYHQ